jgi:Flp pilus assembly protein TadD
MRLIIYAHPDSANAQDSLADAYIAAGQKEPAREALRQALKLIASNSSLSAANKESLSKVEQEKLDQLRP